MTNATYATDSDASAAALGRAAPAIELVGVVKEFASHGEVVAAVNGDRSRHRAGRVLLHARAVRLRQDHHHADDRRLRGADARARCSLHGNDVTGVPANKRDVNMVFQSYALFPHMSVAENVVVRAASSARCPRPEIRERVGEILEIVDLAGREKRRPKELSGGQQQRVALARALVNRPQRAAARRAARRARPQAAPGHAGRAEAHPARGRHHVRLRHARPGRGADHVGPHRGDERGLRSSTSARRGRSTSTRPRKFVAGFIGTSNLLDGVVSERRRRACRARGSTPASASWCRSAGRRRSRSEQRLELTVRPEKIDLHRAAPADTDGQRPPRHGDRGRLPRHLDQLQRHDVGRGRRRGLRPERLVMPRTRRSRRHRLADVGTRSTRTRLEPVRYDRATCRSRPPARSDPAAHRAAATSSRSPGSARRLSAAGGLRRQGPGDRHPRRRRPTRSQKFWAGKTGTGHVDFANWPLYMDPKKPELKKFTAQTGITVTYKEVINDDPTWFAKIQPQLAAEPVDRLRPDGHHQRRRVRGVRRARASSRRSTTRRCRTSRRTPAPKYKNEAFDQGNVYSVPWASGITGIGYNPKYVKTPPTEPRRTC